MLLYVLRGELTMSTISNRSSGLKVNIQPSVQRQTPATDFGSTLKSGLGRTASVIGQGAGMAAPFVPGAATLSAAVTSLGALKSSAGQMGAQGSNAIGLGGGSGVGTSGVSGSSSLPGMGGDAVASAAGGGDSSSQLMQATREMQELNMSFNMQYLQLQQKMQQDNRQFTMLSNIMKTKHDTAKNAISNVR
jgi:hypothetical protein